MEEEMPLHPATGLAAIGIINGKPVWPVLGGAEDDDDDDGDDADDDAENMGGDDDNDDDGDDADDDEGKEKPAAKKPPVKVEPPKKITAKPGETRLELTLRRERDARKSAERQLRSLRQQNESDAERIQREAEEKAEAKYKPTAIRSAAKAALSEAKFKGDSGRGVRLIDLDALEVDDEGEVIGLDAQIAALKEEYTEMFEADAEPVKPKKKVAGRIDPAGKKPPTDDGVKKTSAEKLAELAGMGADA